MINFVQVMIFVPSAVAIWLLNLNNKFSKYGAILGLLAQPFWFISAYETKSWGIFAVSFIYTISYAMGIYNFWVKINRKNKIKAKGRK